MRKQQPREEEEGDGECRRPDPSVCNKNAERAPCSDVHHSVSTTRTLGERVIYFYRQNRRRRSERDRDGCDGGPRGLLTPFGGRVRSPLPRTKLNAYSCASYCDRFPRMRYDEHRRREENKTLCAGERLKIKRAEGIKQTVKRTIRLAGFKNAAIESPRPAFFVRVLFTSSASHSQCCFA